LVFCYAPAAVAVQRREVPIVRRACAELPLAAAAGAAAGVVHLLAVLLARRLRHLPMAFAATPRASFFLEIVFHLGIRNVQLIEQLVVGRFATARGVHPHPGHALTTRRRTRDDTSPGRRRRRRRRRALVLGLLPCQKSSARAKTPPLGGVSCRPDRANGRRMRVTRDGRWSLLARSDGPDRGEPPHRTAQKEAHMVIGIVLTWFRGNGAWRAEGRLVVCLSQPRILDSDHV
jgi:hypothetical protein